MSVFIFSKSSSNSVVFRLSAFMSFFKSLIFRLNVFCCASSAFFLVRISLSISFKALIAASVASGEPILLFNFDSSASNFPIFFAASSSFFSFSFLSFNFSSTSILLFFNSFSLFFFSTSRVAKGSSVVSILSNPFSIKFSICFKSISIDAANSAFFLSFNLFFSAFVFIFCSHSS